MCLEGCEGERNVAISVRAALEIEAVKACRILGGRAGLDREIWYINAMEQPDITGWVRKNELMITTGYVIREDKEKLLELIRNLNDIGAAGLMIKTEFFSEFPKEAGELADRLSFPLMSWPDDMSFITLMHPIMEAVVESQSTTLKRVQNSLEQTRTQTANRNLFEDLQSGMIPMEQIAEERTTALDWPQLPIRLIVFDIRGYKELRERLPVEKLLERKEKILKIIVDSLGEKEQFHGVAFTRNDNFVGIVRDRGELDDLKCLVNVILLRLETRLNQQMRVGISEIGWKFREISSLYRNAMDAIEIIRRTAPEASVACIEELWFPQLLKNVAKNNLTCIRRMWEPLEAVEAYDREHEGVLMETLQVYLDHSCQKQVTADQLFLHRNTLTYRLKKIEAILGFSPEEHDRFLELSILFYLRKFM